MTESYFLNFELGLDNKWILTKVSCQILCQENNLVYLKIEDKEFWHLKERTGDFNFDVRKRYGALNG